MVLGDDVFHRPVPMPGEFLERLEELGCICKEYVITQRDDMEFCKMEFGFEDVHGLNCIIQKPLEKYVVRFLTSLALTGDIRGTLVNLTLYLTAYPEWWERLGKLLKQYDPLLELGTREQAIMWLSTGFSPNLGVKLSSTKGIMSIAMDEY